MIYVAPHILELIASEFGTAWGGQGEAGSPRTQAEVEADEDAAEAAEQARAAHLAEMRRRLWGVMHRLPKDEAAIIQGIAAGQSHRVIAERLGCGRSSITERLPTIVNRLRYWLGLPELPDSDDLRTHLAECAGLRRHQPRRLVAYLDGDSLRDISAADGQRHHESVRRSIKRGMAKVRACEDCATCAAVIEAFEKRGQYRPPTAAPRLADDTHDEMEIGA